MADTSLNVKLVKSGSSFEKSHDPNNTHLGTGQFFLRIEITAPAHELYVPVSIASGKKPAGFVYLLEGTAPATLSSASISCEGDGITQITLGTILYARIPVGKTATFRIMVEMRGKGGEEYGVTITKIHYKHTAEDARYETYSEELHSETLRA